MDGEGTRWGKLKWAAVLVLSLVGIAVLGESGLLGLVILAIALAFATVLVVRA